MVWRQLMKFIVGEKVAYELSRFMTSRWFGNRDYGGIGQWETGTIVCIHSDKIEVLGTSGLSIWPLPGHPDYIDDQWLRPGFLNKTANLNQPNYKLTVIVKKCVCGSHATYGKDCKLHADWCDLYEKM